MGGGSAQRTCFSTASISSPLPARLTGLLVGVIQFQAGKVAHEHLNWDQATVLSQLGVLEPPAAAAGVGSAAQLLKLR
jgi:carboxymethylenebutenolidase